jgi:hypothetical protein
MYRSDAGYLMLDTGYWMLDEAFPQKYLLSRIQKPVSSIGL